MNLDHRPITTVVLAMTADGKIADQMRSPARFGSARDKAHLEQQIALVDAVLFGAETLRAYGTTLSITHPELLRQRNKAGKPVQPIQIVASASGKINPKIRFFEQSVPRWLITTATGGQLWHKTNYFKRILLSKTIALSEDFDWQEIFYQLKQLEIDRLAVLGGGRLVASLLAEDLIDEFWLTICPLILGGKDAPTPVAGAGFLAQQAKQLKLVRVEQIEQEVFLNYLVIRP